MVIVTYLIIINLLAVVGIMAIVCVIDDIKTARKIKKENARKEQMKKELLEIMNEIKEEEK